MSPLYIIGAGGFGREVAHWLSQSPDCGTKWRLAGFLDDNAEALQGFATDLKVVGSIQAYRPAPGDLLVCAVSQPKVKQPVVAELASRGARFLTFVHPRAIIGGNVRLGEGCIVCPGAVLTCDLVVGPHTTINVNATIGHDARVGAFCLISGHADITGFCQIGDGAFLGSHATMVPRTIIGDGATVAAGAAVFGKVEPGVTVAGNPAARI
jgi:sugar O-acyltransferase (sialic acid O-acetyltransferase NeuD family)